MVVLEEEGGKAYGEGSFEGDEVLAHAVDCCVWDDGLAVFQLGCHVHGLPLYRSLHLVSHRGGGLVVVEKQTLAAAKMSLTDCDISGPMPSPSMRVTVNLPWPFVNFNIEV